jgi:hypothetical protein
MIAFGRHGVVQDLKFVEAEEPLFCHGEAGECHADRGVREDASITDGEFEWQSGRSSSACC